MYNGRPHGAVPTEGDTIHMKKFLQEFKDFAMRGSVIDLAVGVIIGGAFQKIVNSLVKDILSPILGLFAKNSFDNLSVSFMGVTVRYGAFITEVLNFIIMAFIIFLLVKALNGLAKFHIRPEDDVPTTKECPFCMSEIDINATRCPHCTSILPEEDETKDTENKDGETPESEVSADAKA